MFTDAIKETNTNELSSSSSTIYSKAYDLNRAIDNAQDKL